MIRFMKTKDYGCADAANYGQRGFHGAPPEVLLKAIPESRPPLGSGLRIRITFNDQQDLNDIPL